MIASPMLLLSLPLLVPLVSGVLTVDLVLGVLAAAVGWGVNGRKVRRGGPTSGR